MTSGRNEIGIIQETKVFFTESGTFRFRSSTGGAGLVLAFATSTNLDRASHGEAR